MELIAQEDKATVNVAVASESRSRSFDTAMSQPRETFAPTPRLQESDYLKAGKKYFQPLALHMNQ